MKSTDKLLSVTKLKQYFPIGTASPFSKNRLYVRANEEISLSVMPGETVGLVGESGCGKSTFGRTLLQLYSQTAGTTVYYGRTVEELMPRYVMHMLKHAKRTVRMLHKKKARADKLCSLCDKAKGDARFFFNQNKTLALAEADTAWRRAAGVLGGFVTLPDPTDGARLIYQHLRCLSELSRIEGELSDAQRQLSERKGRETLTECSRTRQRLTEKKKRLEQEREKAARALEEIGEKLHSLRSRYRDDAAFCECENMCDGGIDLGSLTYGEMRQLRRDLQIIFQDPYSSLNPRMTVGQIIEEGLVTHGFFKRGSPEMREYVLDVMHRCGLEEHMLHRYPHEFSGGQRQRICIARALAVKPRFVVCDECVSALDVSIQSQIINLLEDLKEKEKLTYLFISHDLSVVRYISDRVGVMYLGTIVELCDAKRLYEDPRHPYTVALLSSVPTTDPDGAVRDRILLSGSLPSPVRPPLGCKFHTRCFMASQKCRVEEPLLCEVEAGHFVACHYPEKKIGAEEFLP